jgi:hypothetical protein
MKIKLSQMAIVLAGFMTAVSCITNIAFAGLITVDQWHLTTDEFGGLRQSSASDDVYYAVSKITKLNWNNTYQAIEGYHFASHQEWQNLVGTEENPNLAYYNQGGWSGYRWEGEQRMYFLFSDTLQTDFVKLSNTSDTTSHKISLHKKSANIAGFMMIKDDDYIQVPEPSSLTLLLISLFGGLIFQSKYREKVIKSTNKIKP